MNREGETFVEFLKKYWWIEGLVVAKVIYFLNAGYYSFQFGLMFIFGALVVLWILYRLGME